MDKDLVEGNVTRRGALHTGGNDKKKKNEEEQERRPMMMNRRGVTVSETRDLDACVRGANESAMKVQVKPRKSSSPPLGVQSKAMLAQVRQYPRELDAGGNVEYKYRLVNISEDRIENLRTQMKWRVEEGRGEGAVYRIGVMDNGQAVGISRNEMIESLATLDLIAKPLGFETRVIEILTGMYPDHEYATVEVKKIPRETDSTLSQQKEVRVAIVGPFDAGKSSITGFLTKGVIDDGNGKAGRCVAVHKHEIHHGRTSSFSSYALPPFSESSDASSITPNIVHGIEDIFSEFELHHHAMQPNSMTSKIVSLLDSGGHPKSLTSCLRGIASSSPDFIMICASIQTITECSHDRMTVIMDFLRIARQALIPHFLVITKCDLAQDSLHDENIAKVFGPCTQVTSDTVQEVMNCVFDEPSSKQQRVLPYLQVSCVTGNGMDCLTKFLNKLHPSNTHVMSNLNIEPSAVLSIRRRFNIENDQFANYNWDDEEDDLFTSSIQENNTDADPLTIVIGVLQSGMLSLGQSVFVGPDRDRQTFAQATIISMRCASNAPITCAKEGTTVSLCLKFENIDDSKQFATRGAIVCTSPGSLESNLARTFTVSISDINSSNLKTNQEVITFVGAVKQAAKIVRLERKGDDATLLTLKFVYRSEYVLSDIVFIRQGMLVCAGKLMDIVPS